MGKGGEGEPSRGSNRGKGPEVSEREKVSHEEPLCMTQEGLNGGNSFRGAAEVRGIQSRGQEWLGRLPGERKDWPSDVTRHLEERLGTKSSSWKALKLCLRMEWCPSLHQGMGQTSRGTMSPPVVSAVQPGKGGINTLSHWFAPQF